MRSSALRAFNERAGESELSLSHNGYGPVVLLMVMMMLMMTLMLLSSP